MGSRRANQRGASGRRTVQRTVAGLLLAPGAGASSAQPSLVAIDDRLSAAGVVVRRMDFPYRLAGRRSPDRPPVLVHAVVEAAGQLVGALGGRADTAQKIALGGRSMGGRICSMAVAEGLPASALVLVSYPLHPPGRPDRMRTEHFADLRVPCLFISGTKDAFATPKELTTATEAVAGPVTHLWIEGGDHGLRRRDAEVADAVRDWVLAL